MSLVGNVRRQDHDPAGWQTGATAGLNYDGADWLTGITAPT